MAPDSMGCFICSSDKFVDEHHYDCQEGRLSPEKVPLCRRCHRTYHDWGIGAFSPDTTDKAIEVENKRREILRSLPIAHPSYRNLPPLKLEDVERSRYWYKKHGIAPPHFGGKKPPKKMIMIPFRIPSNPLCGEDWLRAHLTDYTPEEIGALTIEIGYDSQWLAMVSVADKRGTTKRIIRTLEAPAPPGQEELTREPNLPFEGR